MTATEAMQHPYTAALYYAAHGFEVFPVNYEKAPCVTGGFHSATSDRLRIDDWQEQQKFGAGVALRCKDRDLLAVDVDVKHGSPGLRTWEALVAEHGGIPETVQVRTPSGGTHYWFMKPADLALRYGNDALGRGIDVKESTIAPPSAVHDEARQLRHYTFLPGQSLQECAIAPAPAWLLGMLASTPAQATAKSKKAPPPPGDELWAALNGHGSRVRRALEQAVGAVTLGHADRNDTGFQLGCSLRDSGLPYEVAELCLMRYQQTVEQQGDHAYTREEALTTLSGVYQREPRDDRLSVADQVSDLVDLTLQRLSLTQNAAFGTPSLYVRAGKLVQIRRDEHGRPAPADITEAGLLVEIDRAVRYRKYDKSGHQWVSARPPKEVVQGVLVAPHLPLSALAGIAESPVLRSDGSVLSTPGYDPATNLLYCPPTEASPVPAIPDTPTGAEVQAAFTLLGEVLNDFPYHSPADHANAYAALLTPIVRPAVAGHIPLAAVDSPKQGNGKSLLGEVITVVATGQSEGSITEAKDDEEWRKKITSVLRIGRAVEVIDNVRRGLESGQLASLLTKAEWQDRLLATNEMVTYPARTTWIANGNNLRFGGDMVRRG
jgi:bifunctional DNA primase/polymerase-like protein